MLLVILDLALASVVWAQYSPKPTLAFADFKEFYEETSHGASPETLDEANQIAGIALSKLGDFDYQGALGDAKRALSISSSADLPYLVAGKVLYSRGLVGESSFFFERAYRLNSTRVETVVQLAKLYNLLGQQDKINGKKEQSKFYFEKSLDRIEGSGITDSTDELYRTWAWTYYYLGRYDEALQKNELDKSHNHVLASQIENDRQKLSDFGTTDLGIITSLFVGWDLKRGYLAETGATFGTTAIDDFSTTEIRGACFGISYSINYGLGLSFGYEYFRRANNFIGSFGLQLEYARLLVADSPNSLVARATIFNYALAASVYVSDSFSNPSMSIGFGIRV